MDSADCFISRDLYLSQNLALITDNQIITYLQLFQRVEVCAEQLREWGVCSSDRVAIIAPNSVEFIIALLSLWSIKAIACPLSIRHPLQVLKNQLKEIDAYYLLTSDHGILESKEFSQAKQDLIEIAGGTLHESGRTQPINLEDSIESDATILFTSGSSAQPKAALHTLGNHLWNAKGSNEYVPFTGDDSWLLSLPLYHVSGMSILFRALLAGGNVVLPKENENVFQAIKKYKITHVSLVSTQLSKLLETDATQLNLKVVLVGGSAIPESYLERAVNQKFPVYVTYGMTETASQIATARYPQRAKILNYRNVKTSSSGEILVSGKTVFRGYLKQQDLTQPFDREGWFATGDMGFVDDHGMEVTGRRDNMFISGGENIQPEEIETTQLVPMKHLAVSHKEHASHF